MRKLLLLFILSSICIIGQAQEISTEQWSLITKKTADWCPFCGQYGWTFKNNILDDIEGQPVVFWMAHHSGGLETPTSSAIVDNIPSAGQPVFYINNDNMGVTSGNMEAKRQEFATIIDGLASFPAFAGVGSTAEFDGEKITSTSKVRFLVDLEGGDYWLASYLIDDELIAFQSSQGANAMHENVLMHSLQGSNYFGENINTGSVTANQEFVVEGELDFSGSTNIPDYADGYSIVTILWTRVNGEYTIFNLNRQPVTGSVSTTDLLSDVDVSAFTVGSGQIEITIDSDRALDDASVSLISMNGQVIATAAPQQIGPGTNKVQLATLPLPAGTYIVNVQTPVGSKNVRIFSH